LTLRLANTFVLSFPVVSFVIFSLYALSMSLFCPCPCCHPSLSQSTRCQCLVLPLSLLSSFIFSLCALQCLCSVLVRVVVVHFSIYALRIPLFCHSPLCRRSFCPSTPCKFSRSAIIRDDVVHLTFAMPLFVSTTIAESIPLFCSAPCCRCSFWPPSLCLLNR